MYRGKSQQFLCLADYQFLCPVAGKAIYMAAHERKPSTPSPGRVYALDPQTGSALWQKHFPSFFTSSRQQVVYLRPHTYPWEKRPNLFAMSKQGGRELWSTQLSYDDLGIRLLLCSDTTGADCKDIFRTCLFNKERGKKCRATM